MLGFFKRKSIGAQSPVPVDPGPRSEASIVQTINQAFGGEQSTGGFQIPQIDLSVNLSELRRGSRYLFTKNLYAQGIVEMIKTQVVGPGLRAEHVPEKTICNLSDDEFRKITDDVEARFDLWGNDAESCSLCKGDTMSSIQQYLEQWAFIEGDVLVILRTNKERKCTVIELVRADRLTTPSLPGVGIESDTEVIEGVKIRKATGEQLGYYVSQKDKDDSVYIPSRNSKTGRRTAWLHYGIKGGVRGIPALGAALQYINQLDKVRSASIRKEMLNAMMVLAVESQRDSIDNGTFAQKTMNRMSAVGGKDVTDIDTGEAVNMTTIAEGTMFTKLPAGQTLRIVGNDKTTVGFQTFQETIVKSIAWAYRYPPEVLLLSFNSNYSASAAALAQLDVTVAQRRGEIADMTYNRIFATWLVTELHTGRIKIPAMARAVIDKKQFTEFAAWASCKWAGMVAPQPNQINVIKGILMLIEAGLMTHEQATARLGTGKYANIIARLKVENAMKPQPKEELTDGSNSN